MASDKTININISARLLLLVLDALQVVGQLDEPSKKQLEGAMSVLALQLNFQATEEDMKRSREECLHALVDLLEDKP